MKDNFTHRPSQWGRLLILPESLTGPIWLLFWRTRGALECPDRSGTDVAIAATSNIEMKSAPMVPEESEEEDSSTENGTWKSLPILPLLLTLCIIYFIQFILGLIHFSLWDGWLVLLCPTFLPLALFLITGNHIRLLSLHLRSSGGATTTPPPLLHPQSLFYAYLLSYVLCLFSNTTLLLFSVLIVLKSMTWGAGGGLQDNGGTTFFVWEVTVGAMGMGLGVQVAILCVLWVAWGREQKRGSLSRASGRGIGYGAV